MHSDYAIMIEKKLVGHHWKGRGGFMPIAIVEHMMQGTLEDTWHYFDGRTTEATYQVSAHYGIGKDGRVWQFVEDEDTAWANGIMQNPDTAIGWLKEVYEEQVNCNLVTLAIEYEGFSGQALTEPQYEAALALHRQLLRRWEIEADSEHIIGHDRIDSLERAHNPGATFPWLRLLRDLAEEPQSTPAGASTFEAPMPLPDSQTTVEPLSSGLSEAEPLQPVMEAEVVPEAFSPPSPAFSPAAFDFPDVPAAFDFPETPAIPFSFDEQPAPSTTLQPELATPFSLDEEMAMPVEVGEAPSMPFVLGDEPTMPFALGDEPVTPVELSGEPAMPFNLVDEPARPFSLDEELAIPFSLAEEPAMPFALYEGPVTPVGLSDEPTMPFALGGEPAMPFNLAEELALPFALDEEPALPFSLAEEAGPGVKPHFDTLPDTSASGLPLADAIFGLPVVEPFEPGQAGQAEDPLSSVFSPSSEMLAEKRPGLELPTAEESFDFAGLEEFSPNSDALPDWLSDSGLAETVPAQPIETLSTAVGAPDLIKEEVATELVIAPVDDSSAAEVAPPEAVEVSPQELEELPTSVLVLEQQELDQPNDAPGIPAVDLASVVAAEPEPVEPIPPLEPLQPLHPISSPVEDAGQSETAYPFELPQEPASTGEVNYPFELTGEAEDGPESDFFDLMSEQAAPVVPANQAAAASFYPFELPAVEPVAAKPPTPEADFWPDFLSSANPAPPVVTPEVAAEPVAAEPDVVKEPAAAPGGADWQNDLIGDAAPLNQAKPAAPAAPFNLFDDMELGLSPEDDELDFASLKAVEVSPLVGPPETRLPEVVNPPSDKLEPAVPTAEAVTGAPHLTPDPAPEADPTKAPLVDFDEADLSGFMAAGAKTPPAPPPTVQPAFTPPSFGFSAQPVPASGFGLTFSNLGGGVISVDRANLRLRPSFEPSTVTRIANFGQRFQFDGYTQGPELRGSTIWYHVMPNEGGDWVHSSLVKLDKPFRP